MDEIQDRVISIMDASGKEDAEIERALHLPRSTVYDWRHGRSQSYKKYMPEFSAYFNVSADYVLGNGQKEKPLTDRERLIQECLDIMNSLPEDLQQAAREQLRALAAVADKNKKK